MKPGYTKHPDGLYRRRVVFGSTKGCQKVTVITRDKEGRFVSLKIENLKEGEKEICKQ